MIVCRHFLLSGVAVACLIAAGTSAAACTGGDGAADQDAARTGDPQADASTLTDAGGTNVTPPPARPRAVSARESPLQKDAGAACLADGGADATEANGDGDAGLVDAGLPRPVDIYDPTDVKSYAFTLSDDAVATFTDVTVATQKTWVSGDFTYLGVTYTNVGFRRKGSSTFRSLPRKASFKVKFDKYVSGQKFYGLKELTLNSSVSDPTFIAERLSYYVFRSLGLPAERAVSAQVTINGEPYGLYANIETPDQDLLTRLYGSSANTLYEANGGGQWTPGEWPDYDTEVGDGTMTDLQALFHAVTHEPAPVNLSDLTAVLDGTEFLRFAATEAAIGFYDGYGFGVYGSPHNYYLAGDIHGVFQLIPWSLDLTWGGRGKIVDASQPRGTNSLLVRCKASPDCWNAYAAQVSSVIGAVEALDIVGVATAWHTQIDALARVDTKSETSAAAYEQATTALYAWAAARPSVVRTQMAAAAVDGGVLTDASVDGGVSP